MTELLEHSGDDQCPVCQAEDLVYEIVLPALVAWEQQRGLKSGQLALVSLLAVAAVLVEQEFVTRDDLEKALIERLDDIESMQSGPPPSTELH
jgi:hypothetical protein